MKTLLDAVRVSGESESIQLVCPQADHGIEIILAGPGTYTSVTVDFYGSISGSFFQLLSSTAATPSNFSDGGITVFSTGKMVLTVMHGGIICGYRRRKGIQLESVLLIILGIAYHMVISIYAVFCFRRQMLTQKMV